MGIPPLNGKKTHPLSDHAKGVLRDLERRPRPPATINPGVVNRLRREGLVETVQRQSPYAKHNGGDCDHLAITEAGRAALSQ